MFKPTSFLKVLKYLSGYRTVFESRLKPSAAARFAEATKKYF